MSAIAPTQDLRAGQEGGVSLFWWGEVVFEPTSPSFLLQAGNIGMRDYGLIL